MYPSIISLWICNGCPPEELLTYNGCPLQKLPMDVSTRSFLRTQAAPPLSPKRKKRLANKDYSPQQELLADKDCPTTGASFSPPPPPQKLLADNGCPVFLKLLSTDAHVGEGRERSEHRASPPSAVLSPRSCHHLHARPRRQRCYVFQQSSADTCRK